MRMLNLGCGTKFHEDWVNVDFRSKSPHVYAHDLSSGIPFRDESFDVVYHSHLLEHFNKADAEHFLRDCLRVLKPGGLLRIAVPDLESLARSYLHCLDQAESGEHDARERHLWSIVEMIDQCTRHHSGGYMKNWWQQEDVPARSFIIERLGAEARDNIQAFEANPGTPYIPPKDPHTVGTFRLSGEAHQWMYDRLSLEGILEQCGFEQATQMPANESAIPDFNTFLLDIETDGTVRKPDSLFMEARKKSAAPRRTRPLKIVHLCESSAGGAGNAAARLNDALLDQGVDSHLYVLERKGNGRNIHTIPCDGVLPETADGQLWRSPLWRINRQKRDQLYKTYPGRPSGLELFSEPTCRSVLHTLPHLVDADIINFHWIPGMVDFNQDMDFLEGRKIVWTMHDMNPFTGGCHYAFDCQRYQKGCGACWQLGSKRADASSQFLALKRKAYAGLDITPVSPSAWLAQCANSSAALRDRDCRVIPNSLPTGVFKPMDREAEKRRLNIPPNTRILLFGADTVTLPRKGFPLLQQALEVLTKSNQADNLVLAVFGHAENLPDLKLPVLHFGKLSNPEQVALAYNLADVFVMPSVSDNLPNTVIESMACGTPVAGFNIGGLPDMVSSQHTGWLAPVNDTQDLARGIMWILNQPSAALRQLCRATALERWAMPVQARNYIELYESLLRDA